MARITKKLTDTEIKKATKTLYDGQGLILTVTESGRKYWRLKFKWDGKDKKKSLGEYPTLSLKGAREIRQKALTKLLEGEHPFDEVTCSVDQHTMIHYVKKYLYWVETNKSNGHYTRVANAFKNDVLPTLGDQVMSSVSAGDIVKVVKVVSDRGAQNSAGKLFSALSHFYSYIIINYPDQFTVNVCSGLKINMLIGDAKSESYAAAETAEDMAEVMKIIKAAKDDSSVKRAIKLLPYVAVRPGNIRSMEWKDIDLDAALWTIPGEKMKTGNGLVVPLASQVVKMLRSWSKDSGYVFPSPMHKDSMLHSLSINRGMSRMKLTVVPHGFRASFSTLMREHSNFSDDAIELQLAHSIGTKTQRAYNRSKLMDERVKCMQWWADYIDKLK